jgi:hypothetical protein
MLSPASKDTGLFNWRNAHFAHDRHSLRAENKKELPSLDDIKFRGLFNPFWVFHAVISSMRFSKKVADKLYLAIA